MNMGVGEIILAALLILLGLCIAYAVFHLFVMLSGGDANAEFIADQLVDGELEHKLVTRWLRRSRWYRNVGGVTGGLAGFLTLSGEQPLGSALTWGLLGMAAGSMLAETHLVTTNPNQPTTRRRADLRPRQPADYWRPKTQLALIFVGLAAGSLALAETIGDSSIEVDPIWAGAAALTVVVTLIFQWRVAVRSRPALPESLRNADDLVRHLAITRGVADPALMAALVLLAKAAGGGHDTTSAILWLVALRVFWVNRRLGLDWLLESSPRSSRDVELEART